MLLFFMAFGENLKEELLFSGPSLKELSGKTKIPYSTLKTYVNCKRATPNAEHAVRIAQALGVTVEGLMLGDTASPASKAPSQFLKEFRQLPVPLKAAIENLVHVLFLFCGKSIHV